MRLLLVRSGPGRRPGWFDAGPSGAGDCGGVVGGGGGGGGGEHGDDAVEGGGKAQDAAHLERVAELRIAGGDWGETEGEDVVEFGVARAPTRRGSSATSVVPNLCSTTTGNDAAEASSSASLSGGVAPVAVVTASTEASAGDPASVPSASLSPQAPATVATAMGDLLHAIRDSGGARDQTEVADIVDAPTTAGDREEAALAAIADAAVTGYNAGLPVPTGESVDDAVTRASDRCVTLGATVDLPDPP